jgi:hypothetical protein
MTSELGVCFYIMVNRFCKLTMVFGTSLLCRPHVSMITPAGSALTELSECVSDV